MSRSGYSDDCDDILMHGRWRGQVASVIRGKNGQAFLLELLASLDAMPEKRLITEELRKDGEVCTLGALGVKRGINLEAFDPEDYDAISNEFGIAPQLIQEIEFMNDEDCGRLSPEERWTSMHKWINSLIKVTSATALKENE